MNMKRRALLWPAVILLSALAAGLVNFVIPGAVGRPIIVMWFLFVCPGMVLVRFFRLSEAVSEWTLAIALSLPSMLLWQVYKCMLGCGLQQ